MTQTCNRARSPGADRLRLSERLLSMEAAGLLEATRPLVAEPMQAKVVHRHSGCVVRGSGGRRPMVGPGSGPRAVWGADA